MAKRKVTNDELLEAAAALLANDEDYVPLGTFKDMQPDAPNRADAFGPDGERKPMEWPADEEDIDGRALGGNLLTETASDEQEVDDGPEYEATYLDPGEYGVAGFLNSVPVFVTPDGTVLELKQINALVLMHVFAPNRGKPKPPKKKVRLAGGHERLEEHPDDEDYLEQVAEWQTGHSLKGLVFIFNYGIKTMPPAEFYEAIEDLYEDDLSTKDVKFLWIASLCDAPETQEALIEAIMGLAVPTEAGLDEAENFTELPLTDGPS